MYDMDQTPLKFFFLKLLMMIFFMNGTANAQVQSGEVSVSSGTQSNLANIVPSQSNIVRSCKGTGCPLKFVMKTSCYGTNLRNGANPISPDSMIEGTFTFTANGKKYTIWVLFPGLLSTKAGAISSSVDKYSVDSNNKNYYLKENNKVFAKTESVVVIGGNTMVIYTPFDLTTASGVSPAKPPSFENFTGSFSQTVYGCAPGPKGTLKGPIYGCCGASSFIATYACGAYMAKNGVVSSTVHDLTYTADGSTLEVTVDFPGQVAFCGGYFSPLMVFLDDKRPSFDNLSDFPLFKGAKTHWPEKKHPGYFLVYDKNDSGNIKYSEQLFGNSDKAQNGFEKLKGLDSNKDGWIDEKDAAFEHLYLWKDLNGDGKSTANELTPAKQMVHRIHLKYEKGHLTPLSRYAEEREYATIEIKSKNGKIKKARISDIWLSPEGGPN